MDIWKPRMKQRKGMRQGMGRGRTFQITLLQWNIFVFSFFGTLSWFSSPVGPSNLRFKNQTQLGLQTQEELKMISYIRKRKNFWKFWNLTEIEGPFQFKWGSSMGTRIMLWGPPTIIMHTNHLPLFALTKSHTFHSVSPGVELAAFTSSNIIIVMGDPTLIWGTVVRVWSKLGTKWEVKMKFVHRKIIGDQTSFL
jgi:hypothetical protein